MNYNIWKEHEEGQDAQDMFGFEDFFFNFTCCVNHSASG